MRIPVITYTIRDLRIEESKLKEFLDQEGIVKHLRREAITLLYLANVAFFEISEDEFLIIKCRDIDLAGVKVNKTIANALAQHFAYVIPGTTHTISANSFMECIDALILDIKSDREKLQRTYSDPEYVEKKGYTRSIMIAEEAKERWAKEIRDGVFE